MALATGILETRGMAALVAATDDMLKAADVRIVGRHGVGSGWVTIVVAGEVAAVETALRRGQETAAGVGEVIRGEVIARPETAAAAAMPHVAGAPPSADGDARALGILETLGVVPLIEGVDAGVKAAAVDISGWAAVGGALCHVAFRGDVAAVQTAMDAGRAAAAVTGTVIAGLVLPQPADGVGSLLPPLPAGAAQLCGALGMVETTGYVAAVTAGDAMVKEAEVQFARLTIGSGGRVVAVATGSLDSVQAAVRAAAAATAPLAEVAAARVISRPDVQTLACFGQPAVPQAAAPPRAMGLIETRSTIGLVAAIDQMLKAARVEYAGRYKVGYFLTAAVVRGDVGAVKAALDAGAKEAARHGELVAVHLIPRPYPELEERLSHR
jgi:microcompartment protein CcmL/EutN